MYTAALALCQGGRVVARMQCLRLLAANQRLERERERLPSSQLLVDERHHIW